MRAAVVVAGGEPPLASTMGELPDGAWVVAADSGFDHARDLGLDVDLLVGDLDSISPPGLTASAHLPRVVVPADKDFTDLELALRVVAERDDIDRVVVVGGIGGRFDHLVGNIGVLTADWLAHLQTEWIAGRARCHVTRDGVRLHGDPDEPISLVPMGGPAGGVTTEGLLWPLTGETLAFGSTRGVSNRFVRSVATVHVTSGTLMTIQPEALG